MLSIPTGDRYPPLNFTPQKRKEKTLHAQVAQVEGLAARQPVLMVFEDVHWSDPTTRELLDLLIDRVSTLRVLVIITFRPEFTPPWVGHPHVTMLNLSRLPDPDGTRRHIRAALAAGANHDEILLVLKCAAAMSIHSCSLGAPILLEEAKAAGSTAAPKNAAPTPACDKMRAAGQWDMAWDPFLALDPEWTNEFMATAVGIYGGSVLTPKEIELLSIAFDASYTHMYAPGTRRHIKAALKAGATMEEIMEVLKLCVVQGVQACNLGVPILAEEMARSSI